jgi:hypothetical protein
MSKKTWIVATAFSLPWAILMIIYDSIVKGGLTISSLVWTLIGGLIAGILFALTMQYVAGRLYKKNTVELADDERVMKEGPANHFKRKEGVGGKLVLTNRRLIFKSHKINIQVHQHHFDLGQIERVKTTRTLRFLENGLTVELTNNESHKFIVDAPNDWADVIIKSKESV